MNHRRIAGLPWIIGLIVVLIMEIGFFNLGFWRTATTEPALISKPEIGSGLTSLGDDQYRIDDPATATVTVDVKSPTGDPITVSSIRVVPGPEVGDTARERAANQQTVTVSYKPPTAQMRGLDSEWVETRSSDGAWGDSSQSLTYTSAPATQYMIIGPATRAYTATKVCITFQGKVGETVSFARMQVNPRIPFSINLARLSIELLLVLFLVVFRPSSKIYTLACNEMSIRQRRLHYACLALFIAVMAVFCVVITNIRFDKATPTYSPVFGHWIEAYQYQRLADALIHGRTYLDLPVDSALQTMDNPYSYEQRRILGIQGHQFFWDHAYYQGHYYSYFGIVPALLTFVPYQLITGSALSNGAAAAIFAILAIAFCTLFIDRLIKTYAPSLSLGFAWLLIIGIAFGSCLIINAEKATFYSMPVLCSLALTFAGLYVWLCSMHKGGTVNPWLIALGSLLIALNLGSRPPFIIACFVALAMFWPYITRYRSIFSLRNGGVASTIATIGPFLLVGALQCAYNKQRFGSWFNFGENYNLTGFDMTTRHGSIWLLPQQIFVQLFQPLAMKPSFPFITTNTTSLGAPNEASIGGFLFIAPISLCIFAIWIVRKQLTRMHVWGLTVTCIIAGLFVAMYESYKCGTSMRYYADFAWLLLIAVAFVVMALAQLMVPANDVPHRVARMVGSTGYVEQPNIALRTNAAEIHYVQRTLVKGITATLVFLGILIMLFGSLQFTNCQDMCPQLYYTVHSWFIGLTA